MAGWGGWGENCVRKQRNSGGKFGKEPVEGGPKFFYGVSLFCIIYFHPFNLGIPIFYLCPSLLFFSHLIN